MTVLIATVTIDVTLICLTGIRPVLVVLAASHLILLAGWIGVVRDRWVAEQADTFTQQFFITLTSIELARA